MGPANEFGDLPVAPKGGANEFGDAPVSFISKKPPLTMNPQTTMSAQPQSTSIGGKVSQWANDAVGDINYGGDKTFIGRGLARIGARPLREGVSPETAEFMGSPVLGTLRAVQGAGELAQPGKRWEGTKDVLAGAGQAAQIPLGFMGPGEARAGVMPLARRAGEVFQEVGNAAKNIAPDISKAGDVALELKQYADAGGFLPKVARDFLRRATGPNEPPINFPESRIFQSNASRLSADEANRLTPPAKRNVGRLSHALGEANQGAAEQVGMGDQFRDAMTEYQRAKRLEDFGQKAKGLATSTAGKVATGAALGAGGSAAYRAYRKLFEKP